MKKVDMDSLVIVHSGEAWTHPGPPCSRAMIRFLERNEDVVTWVQVRGTGGFLFIGVGLTVSHSPRTARWRTSSQ